MIARVKSTIIELGVKSSKRLRHIFIIIAVIIKYTQKIISSKIEDIVHVLLMVELQFPLQQMVSFKALR